MIRPLLSISFFFCLYSCANKNFKPKKNVFNEFIFSNSALYGNYSLKFAESDTFFIEERFPKPSKQFYALLSDSIRMKSNSLFDTLNLARFDTLYLQENLEDGVSYKFYLRNDTLVKTVGIYGHEAPKVLYSFADWLDSFAKTVVRYPTSKQVDFGDLSGINPPSAPSPPKLQN